MMYRLLSVVKRHPIVTFFVLTYAIGWGLIRSGPSRQARRSSPPLS